MHHVKPLKGVGQCIRQHKLVGIPRLRNHIHPHDLKSRRHVPSRASARPTKQIQHPFYHPPSPHDQHTASRTRIHRPSAPQKYRP